MTRRHFLQQASTAGLAITAGCMTSSSQTVPIIDTHTHFYDPSRPQGVPWPPPDDTVLSRTVLPPEFEALARPLGVQGTIAVEASPWVEDNAWLLELADRSPFIVGVVGNLVPGSPDFRVQLARFAKHRLFRGIRIGRESLVAAIPHGRAQEDLRQLAELNLSLDLLIPPADLPKAADLANEIHSLRIVVDHCGNVPVGSPPPNDWIGGLSACHYTPNVFMKVSGLVEGTGRNRGQAPVDPSFYFKVLDDLWAPFGEDRLIYGSNWPVCLHFASYATVLNIVRTYFTAKGSRASAKYFYRNAATAYRYLHR